MSGDTSDTDLVQTLEKLQNDRLHALVANICPVTLIEKILHNISNTEDRGLHIVQVAVDCFVNYCSLTPEKTFIGIEKVDRGPSKLFSNLRAVSDSRIGNVYDFNASGRQERPTVVYNLSTGFKSSKHNRGLVVEIDGDLGKYKEPRLTAINMWQNLMYSKLVAGSGRSTMRENGFTMRMFITQAEVRLNDRVEYENYTKSKIKWNKNKAEFWQTRCVAILRALTGSVIFCLRNIFMCMMEQDNCWLYKKYKNQYHINIFIGPFKLNLPDTIVNGADVFKEAEADNTPLPVKKISRKKHIKLDDFVENVEWSIDFKYGIDSTCGQTTVQYLLIENFQGLMARPENKKRTNDEETNENHVDVLESRKPKSKQKYNCGLMSLTDILNTPNVFAMFSIIAKPGWKRRNYVKKKKQNANITYKEWFTAMENMCYYMQDFILYHIIDCIEWQTTNMWPMREWMEEIAHVLNRRTMSAVTDTRRKYIMTPDKSDDNPKSLVRRLKQSLLHTLPDLDSTVIEYMEQEGYKNIRDAKLYLRLVGVTNILALEQLARTHNMLLSTDEYHARTFNSLALGTQSEMQLMFDRIVVNPHTTMNVLKILGIDFDNENTSENENKILCVSRERQLMEDFVNMHISHVLIENESLEEWKESAAEEWKILKFLIHNARYFMTFGIYNLARVWNEKIADFCYESTDADFKILPGKIDFFFQESETKKTSKFKDLKGTGYDKEYNYLNCKQRIIDKNQFEEEILHTEIPEICLGNVRLYLFIRCVCKLSIDTDNRSNLFKKIIKVITDGLSYENADKEDMGIVNNDKIDNKMNFESKMMLTIFLSMFSNDELKNADASDNEIEDLVNLSTQLFREHLTLAINFFWDMEVPDRQVETDDRNKKKFEYKSKPAYVLIHQYLDFKSRKLDFKEEVEPTNVMKSDSEGDETSSDSEGNDE